MSRMTDIIKAMRSPANMVDPSLRGYSPVVQGKDIMSASGAYCVVFSLKGKYDSKPSRCLRLWYTSDRDMGGIVSEAEKLASLLPDPTVPQMGRMRFIREALRLPDDGTVIPGLEMPFLNRSLDDLLCSEDKPNSYEYSLLASNMMKLSSAMKESGISHGDLSPANVMVGPDLSLTLIDFDFLLWPSKGIRCPRQILGAADYNRPDRVESPRSLADDHLAEQLIHLNLLAFSKDPSLNSAENMGEAAFFDSSDLVSPSAFRNSEGYRFLRGMGEGEVSHYLDRLLEAMECPYGKIPALCDLAYVPTPRRRFFSPMIPAPYCHECGRAMRKADWIYCPQCGTPRRMIPSEAV